MDDHEEQVNAAYSRWLKKGAPAGAYARPLFGST
jgi:hypothetical protein